MQSPPSSADSSSYRPRGRLLRQETVEYELLLRDKFNMALRINYLEDQLRLLKDGEGYTETDVLTELGELRSALKACEDELRENTLKQIQVVDELETQLEEAKAAATETQSQTQRQGDAAEPDPANHYQKMCSTLQEKLDDMAQQKQKAIDDSNDTRLQIKHLLADFEQQGKAMRDLKNDHDKALDAIYELESELLQQHKGENKERIKTRDPVTRISEGNVKTLTKGGDELGVAVMHHEQFLATTTELHKEDHRQMDGTKLSVRSYRDLYSRLKKKLKCATHEKQKQTEKNEHLRLDNEMLYQALSEAKKKVDTLQADLKVANESIGVLHDADLQLAKDHEMAVQKLEREIANVKHEKQTLDRTWTHRYNMHRVEKEREILKLKGESRHAILKGEAAEKALRRARDGIQAHEGEQEDSHKDQLKNLKESNRIMFQDLQECYAQYKVMFRENTDLLNATKIYKKAIADRDTDIADYKTKIMKYLRQLQDRCSLEQTNDELAQQLKETKAMVAVMSKRLENSPIGIDDTGANDQGSTLSVSARCRLKAIHGDHLVMLSKQLEDVEKSMRQ